MDVIQFSFKYGALEHGPQIFEQSLECSMASTNSIRLLTQFSAFHV